MNTAGDNSTKTAAEQRNISDILAQTTHATQPNPEHLVLYLFSSAADVKGSPQVP
jgi:hypothetical protein